jgi:hypothetical protein
VRHHLIPIGDEVGERTTVVAEGDAAIHAARGLRAQFLLGEREIDLEPITDTFAGRAARRGLARFGEKAVVSGIIVPLTACLRARLGKSFGKSY